MARARFALLALLVFVVSAFLGACCAPTPRAKHFHAFPLVRLDLHADIEFTELERALIAQAVKDLEWQTAGYLAIRLEYDLDYTDHSVGEDRGLLVRSHSYAYETIMVDTKKQIVALGFTYPPTHKSYLVTDRLKSPEMWRHVVMHELLHSAGLDDLPSRPSEIMAGSRTNKIALCMSPKDAQEFCRVLHCDWQGLNYCGVADGG